MASSQTLSSSPTESRKHEPDDELAFVPKKRQNTYGTPTFARDDDGYDSDITLPRTSTNSIGQTGVDFFARPRPLVAWKSRETLVRAQQAYHQQRQTANRFYTQDSPYGELRQSFFRDPSAKAQVILMMETTLGEEHHGDNRCQACINVDIPCVRYIEGAGSEIMVCGSACAWCRFRNPRGGCSKGANKREKEKEDSDSTPTRPAQKHALRLAVKRDYDRRTVEKDNVQQRLFDGNPHAVHTRPTQEGGRETSETPDTMGLKAPVLSNSSDADEATAGITALRNDAQLEDVQPDQQTATQDVSETFPRPGLVALKTNTDTPSRPSTQSHDDRGSSDHPILRLQALLGDLDEEDADEARDVFDLIRRNLEKGRDTKLFVDRLTQLFVPLKQRIAEEDNRLSDNLARVAEEHTRISNEIVRLSNDLARVVEEHDRISNDIALVSRKKQVFDDMDVTANGVNVDGQ